MNKNVLIVLGGAVVVAVLVAMIVQISLGGKKPEVIEEAKVQILVAANDLKIGEELRAADVRWQEWPQNNIFPGAVVRKDNEEEAGSVFTGRLARNVAKGEPMIKAALVGESGTNFVAASLEPGMRAVAIEVSASSMVGGFIGPGDFVDVILTYKETIRTDDDDPRVKSMLELNLDKMATETIIQNVKVLAVDQTATRPEEDKIKVGKTVTLAVTAQDSERLALAQGMGDLTLALRGVGDDRYVVKEWKTVSDARLTSVGDEIFEEYEKLKKDAGIHSNIVRIYNGAQVQVVPTK